MTVRQVMGGGTSMVNPSIQYALAGNNMMSQNAGQMNPGLYL